jgi:hypothetical protein
MNLKIHELTLIFKDKLKKQYEIMQRELEMEELKYKTELVAAKKQFDAKMNGILRDYQHFRIDKLALSVSCCSNLLNYSSKTDTIMQ